MSTTKPLREQELTYRPRIVLRDGIGKFHVEYLGMITGEHCGVSFPTLGAAMFHATNVGRRQAKRVAQLDRARQGLQVAA